MNHKLQYDVIVIGAGMAGLKATQYLANEGHRVLLIEARNRVGGRIHTILTTTGYPVEAGSLLLSNPGTPDKPNPLMPLLLDLNLKTLPLNQKEVDIFDAKGQLQKLLKLQDYYKIAEKMIQKAKETKKTPFPSLASILNYHSNNIPKRGTLDFLARQTITAMITHHTGVSPSKLSLYELMLSEEKLKAEALVIGGYQHLPEALVKALIENNQVTLRLNTPIKEIHHFSKENQRYVVTHDHKKYSAPYILCTVPLGVLKKNALQFFPELSFEKKRLIKHLEVGMQNKIILEFTKPFWREEVQYLYPGSENIQEWPEYINMFSFSKGSTSTLICNFYGEAAHFNPIENDTLIKKALLPLRKLYGKKIHDLKSLYITHWDCDPYTLGSSSACGIALDPSELDSFTIPEVGGLYFAGAHTLSNSHRETVEGAYRSGLRAAIDIHLRLHVSSLTKI